MDNYSNLTCDDLKDYFDHNSLRRNVRVFFKETFPSLDPRLPYIEKVGKILDEDTSMYDFLLNLQEKVRLLNKLTTAQIVCFVLACEIANEQLESTPCSLDNIWTTNLLQIVDTTKHDIKIYPRKEHSNNDTEYITAYHGTYNLIDLGFPVLMADLTRVYFYSGEEDEDIVQVLDRKGNIFLMNKKGQRVNGIEVPKNGEKEGIGNNKKAIPPYTVDPTGVVVLPETFKKK